MSLSSDGVDVDVGPDGVDIDWGFWDAQLEALEAIYSGDYDVVVFRGGYGSGKTILGGRWIHEVSLGVPKSDNLILAPDAAKGGPTTYKKFFGELPGEDTVPDEGGDPENSPIVDSYNRNKSRLTYINGSVARLGSADVWNRYAGGEFNAIWCDEVAHYENTDLFKLNEMLLSRQRTSEGPNVSLWTSTGNGYNDFHQFVELQETPEEEPLPTRIKNVVANSLENPWLEEKDKMQRQFAGTSREGEALYGGFAAAEGLVYDDFSREINVVEESRAAELVDEHADPIWGYDAGWNDPRVLVRWDRTHHDQLIATELFYRSDSHVGDPEDPADGTAIDWLPDEPRGILYAEHQPADIDKFRRAGWDAVKADKSIDEGIDAVRERLERDSSGRPGLLVSKACGDLIREFLTYQEEHVGKSGATDHALDASRYAIFTDSIQPKRERPDHHGVRSL